MCSHIILCIQSTHKIFGFSLRFPKNCKNFRNKWHELESKRLREREKKRTAHTILQCENNKSDCIRHQKTGYKMSFYAFWWKNKGGYSNINSSSSSNNKGGHTHTHKYTKLIEFRTLWNWLCVLRRAIEWFISMCMKLAVTWIAKEREF